TTMAQIPGMTELAPYIITPKGSSFITTSGIDLAGPRWSELPLAAQQLIYDRFNWYTMEGIKILLEQVTDQYDQAEAAGGEFLSFEDDVNDVLAEYNAGLADEWRESPLLADGDGYVDLLQANIEKWN